MTAKHWKIIFLCIMVLCNFSISSYPDLKVYPKIFTPGTPPTNDRVVFEFPTLNDQKPKLKIMNLEGEMVVEISTLNPQVVMPRGWRLFWDGRDENGNLVSPGVYIYQWEESLKNTTGAIVVAR
jgi:hypothetical protein